ncbi:Uncharacterized protein MSYG_0553 [Malassezia sympodialis ATCC 42132]|uniref:LIM zinc-binding domain-containing protein n=1 Tax=Malassezia sympodialis (strain ATCC 42132) TaxID=1230383 RepID=A0A1M8A184_MALS4|nr:Uncharacterized protein MSYG_0553 [Malassezia sympodialis ATCC 42132]
MPPVFGPAPQCPRCHDRVYAAEQVLGPRSVKYHRRCLKCVVCNRLLDSVTLLEHDGEPICHNCHKIHLGQGKDKFGTAVPLRPSIQPARQASHHRSASLVHPPVTPESASLSNPKMSSATSLPSISQPRHRPLPMAPSGSAEPMPLPESLLSHATSSSSPLEGEKHASASSLHTQAPLMLGGTPLCARCRRPVYFAEQKQAAGRKWHRACLRCDGCRATLDTNRVEEGPADQTTEDHPNIWCHMCYSKNFGPKGIGVAGMSYPSRTVR